MYALPLLDFPYGYYVMSAKWHMLHGRSKDDHHLFPVPVPEGPDARQAPMLPADHYRTEAVDVNLQITVGAHFADLNSIFCLQQHVHWTDLPTVLSCVCVNTAHTVCLPVHVTEHVVHLQQESPQHGLCMIHVSVTCCAAHCLWLMCCEALQLNTFQ